MVIGQQITIPPIPHGSLIEKIIVGRLVTDLLAAGYKLRVYDGEEYATDWTTDAAAIYEVLSSTEMDRLDATKDGSKIIAWIVLVWGNDTDIISDYTTSLEATMKPINEFVNTLETR